MEDENKDLEQLNGSDIKSEYYSFLKEMINKYCNANGEFEIYWDYRDEAEFRNQLPKILADFDGTDILEHVTDYIMDSFIDGGYMPEDELYGAIENDIDENASYYEMYQEASQNGDLYTDLVECGYNGIDVGAKGLLESSKIDVNITVAPYNEQNYDMGSIISAFGSDYLSPEVGYIDETYLDNSITYLLHQQGHTVKELYDVLYGKETSSKLLKSIEDEINNNAAEATCGLTVCTQISAMTYAELIKPTAKYVVFSEDSVLGLHNSWIGSSSLMEIALEKPFVVPTSDIMKVRPDGVSGSGDYSVGDVYGGSVSNENSSVSFTDEAPELVEENLEETLNYVKTELLDNDLNESLELSDDIEAQAQNIVNGCKEAYANNDLETAYDLWSQLYDLFIPESEEEFRALSDEERTHRFVTQQKFMDQFTDEEVYAITDYGKRKEYRKMGYDY